MGRSSHEGDTFVGAAATLVGYASVAGVRRWRRRTSRAVGGPCRVLVAQVEDLSKRYGTVQALDRVDVEISQGCTGLVGSNGAGKSTLIKLLLGLLVPDQGRATVLGHDVALDPLAVRGQVGYLPEGACRPGSGRPRSATRSASRRSATGPWAGSPPACSSGSSWPWPWFTTRACCCWTSRPTAWTPRAGRTCSTWSPASAASSASTCWSRPTCS